MALAKGTLKAGDKKFKAGTLGEFEIQGDNILLGQAVHFQQREHRPV